MLPFHKMLPGGLILIAAVLFLAFTAATVVAENEGQGDLDRATEAKLTATKLADLNGVITLCKSAIGKGLSEGNKKFAEQLLASTLIQRGMVRAKLVDNPALSGVGWTKTRQAALDDLQQAVKLSPDQPIAQFQIARLNLLPGGDRLAAAAALDRVIELDVDNPSLRGRALVLRAGLETDVARRLKLLDEAVTIGSDLPAALRSRALAHAAMNQLDKALVDLNKAIELDPKHAATLEVKSLVLIRMNKLDEALAALDEMQKLQPDSIYPRIQKARILTQSNKLEEALAELDEAQRLVPENAAVLLLRAGVLQQLGKPDRAMADVDAAIKASPDLQPAMRIRAALLAASGEIDKAVEQLDKLRKLAPKDVLVMVQLAALHHSQKKYQKAIEDFSAALAQRPDLWLAMRGRADAQLALGKHDLAIADYDKALKLKPDDASLLNNLAWVLATSPKDDLRDGKRAIELANEACRLTEYKQAYILSTLAAAYAESGDFENAKKWIDKAIEIGGPDQPPALKKERKRYRKSKPWRELITEEKP
jgi:tetratricopeptide (TPR) repeat protein